MEGYNSPKVAAQTIVYATAHTARLKGETAGKYAELHSSSQKHRRDLHQHFRVLLIKMLIIPFNQTFLRCGRHLSGDLCMWCHDL